MPACTTAMPSVRYAVALYSWDGEGTSGEAGGYLLFAAGARIEILEEGEPDSWWHGSLGEASGWYPSSFTSVEELPTAAGVEEIGAAGGSGATNRAGAACLPQLPRTFSRQVLDLGLDAFEAGMGDSPHSGVVRV